MRLSKVLMFTDSVNRKTRGYISHCIFDFCLFVNQVFGCFVVSVLTSSSSLPDSIAGYRSRLMVPSRKEEGCVNLGISFAFFTLSIFAI